MTIVPTSASPGRTRSANWFRDRRKQLGLTREHVAAELQVTVSTIANWERAQSYPLPTKARELCRVYAANLPDMALQIVSLSLAVDDRRNAA